MGETTLICESRCWFSKASGPWSEGLRFDTTFEDFHQYNHLKTNFGLARDLGPKSHSREAFDLFNALPCIQLMHLKSQTSRCFH